MSCTTEIPAKTVRSFIKLYQLIISPFIRPCCRFHPSCSEYALEAIKIHGTIKGLTLASTRLLSCHPWSSRQGFYPVPTNTQHINTCATHRGNHAK